MCPESGKGMKHIESERDALFLKSRGRKRKREEFCLVREREREIETKSIEKKNEKESKERCWEKRKEETSGCVGFVKSQISMVSISRANNC